MNLKVDKNLAASIALHVFVLGYGLVSFSARSLEAPPPESMPVDIISADQLSKITAGSKTGEKDKPKPLVEKVADAKPVDDTSGKIAEKPPVETEAAPPPKPPVEKPVEKKPDPPKPVVENKPKDEPKPIEKKPDPPKVDPIAEALKHDDSKKPVPKAEAKAAAPQPPQKPKERVFDATKMAALIDKRDPTRQAATGAQLNSQASLGASNGTAATLSQSELDAMRARLASLWNVQPGTERPEELFVDHPDPAEPGSPARSARRRSCRTALRRAIRRRPMPRSARCCRASLTPCCATRPTSSGNTWTSISIRKQMFHS